MKATSRLRPSAISAVSVQGPSAITWPTSTRWPSSTMTFWLKHVPWFERSNLRSRYVSYVASSLAIVTWSAETSVTTPDLCAAITSPASTAARYSMPVPTRGASLRSSGTA